MALSRYTGRNSFLTLYTPKTHFSPNPKICFPKAKPILPKLENLNLKNNQNNQKEEEDENSSSASGPGSKTPRNIVVDELPSVSSFCANENTLKEDVEIHPTPSFHCVSRGVGFLDALNQKIKICNMIFDFSQPKIQIKAKQIKTKELKGIYSLIHNRNAAISLPPQYQNMILDMIKKNVFDQNPFISFNNPFGSKSLTGFFNTFYNEGLDSMFDPSWTHLELVYKILNEYLFLFPQNVQPKYVEKAIRLMNLPDSKERDALACFIVNYLSTHPNDFDLIWNYITVAISNVLSEIYTPFCIQPILVYLITINTNQRSKVKGYLKKILYSHLIPLFHLTNLSLYSTFLTTLVVKIIEDDENEFVNVVNYLMKTFPRQDGVKQSFYFNSISKILRKLTAEEFIPLGDSLTSFIANCIYSPNNKLVEEALNLFIGKYVSPRVLYNPKLVASKLQQPVAWAARFHWSKTIREEAQTALSIIKRCDYNASKNLMKDINQTLVHSTNEENNKLIKSWAMISRAAARRDKRIDLTQKLQNLHIAFLKEEKDAERPKPVVTSRVHASTPLCMTSLTHHANSQKCVFSQSGYI